MSTRKKTAPQRDWTSKTLAGALLGLTLAFGISAIYSALHTSLPLNMRGQLAMWIVPPVCLVTLGGVYFFRSGLRAWCWLGTANLLTYGAWLALRHYS